MRFLEQLIVPVAFLTGVIGLVYWYWTTTPSYAVNQVVWSIRHRDTGVFQKYVDVDSISSKAFDDLVHGKARASLLGSYDAMIGSGIVSYFKPELVAIAREYVVKCISAGTLSRALSQRQPAAVTAPTDTIASGADDNLVPSELCTSRRERIKINQALRDYGFCREGFRGIAYLKATGPVAYLGLKFHSLKSQQDFIVEFRLDDAGGYWRITELSNLDDLIAQYLKTCRT
jgi:hypothetical protein